MLPSKVLLGRLPVVVLVVVIEGDDGGGETTRKYKPIDEVIGSQTS